MKYLLSLSMLLFSIGCGPAHVNMPDEIKPYYNQYFDIVGRNFESSGDITIKPVDEGREAYCETHPFGNWNIFVNQDHWAQKDDLLRKILIFHELTHCVFHSSLHSARKDSYMYPSQPEEWILIYLGEDGLKQQVLSYIHSL